jgi:signal transduction histidine kinase
MATSSEAPASGWRLIDHFPLRLTSTSAIAISIIATILIGVGDWVTGFDLPFTLLYLLPITLGTWYRGRYLGSAMSLLAALSIALSLIHDRMSSFAVAWNLGGATVLFLTASWAVDELRMHMDRERALRSMAVDQLRHAERLNVIGTMAAGVAHELGTPLNVIGGCAELLAEGSSDEHVLRRTKMILDQVTRVSTIIRRLLDFGHRERAKSARVDLNAVATGASELLTSTANKHNCTIKIETTDAVGVAGHAAELEQVISNLILNAVQAMERGAIMVRVGAERDVRRIGWIEVEDCGSGMAPQTLARIFDPFFTTKGVGEGTGLGLSVSYGIVRDHQGTIEVDSEVGRGSRFRVVLPLRD